MKWRHKEKKSEKQYLWKIWLILGIIFLLYFFLLISFAGFTNVFYFIWLIGGLGCLVFSWMAKIHFVRRFMPGWLKIGLGILISFCVIFFCVIEAFILSGFYREPEEEADYVIVLGAHVNNGKPSKVLANRLDTAFDYAMEHENVIVIVSGGQGGNETTTEAYAMAAYLEQKGLEKERIWLEEKSTDTNENLTFSQELIGNKEAKIAVVSNDFHIFRAVHLARKKGFYHPQGLAARDDIRTMPANLAREFFGVMKDWVCGNMDLFPLW